MKRIIVVFGFLAIFQSTALAADSPKHGYISFNYLAATSPSENSSLSGECTGTTADPKVTCTFTQTSVRYELDPKDAASEIAKSIAALRTEAGKDPKKYLDEMCAGLKKSLASADLTASSIKSRVGKRFIEETNALCANPTMSAAEQWMRQMAMTRTRQCRVSSFQNDPVTFKRVSSTKWVANDGPKGICQSIYLYTLERDPKHTNLWTWTQVRTYADTTGELCKDMRLNEKIEFSWKSTDKPDVTCEAVSFGF